MKEKIINHKKELLIASLFLSISLFLGLFIIKESDYFWHITAGKYMLNNGPIKQDIFSWSVNSKYWYSHEWLFEVLIAFLNKLFGNISMIIYTTSIIIGIFSIIFIYNKDKMKNNMLFTSIWIGFSGMMMPFVQTRPHLISFLFTTLCIYSIYSLINNQNSKKIYFIPLITILWSNFHGGSSNLGYLFCFITLLFGLFNFNCEKIYAERLTKKQIYKLLGVGLVSIFCTGINIHGFKMTLYPYMNLMDSTMLANIQEWTPTTLSETSHLSFFITGIIILFIFLLSNKKIRFMDFVLFGLSLALGLKAIRFWPYLYLISSFFIFDYIKDLKFKNIQYIIIIIDLALITSFVIYSSDFINEVDRDYYKLNDEIIGILKDEKPEKLFNSYDIGGELIYHKVPVFIDGRADLYSEQGILKQYLAISNINYDYKALLDLYDFDYFLIDRNCTLNEYLKYNDNYEIIYNNYEVDYVLYKKKTS